MQMFQPLARTIQPWAWSLRESNLFLFCTLALLSMATLTLGLWDIRSFSLCLAETVFTLPTSIGLGAGITSLMSTAVVFVGLRHYAEWNMEKRPKSMEGSGSQNGDFGDEACQKDAYFIRLKELQRSATYDTHSSAGERVNETRGLSIGKR
jgi:hypothetical protein